MRAWHRLDRYTYQHRPSGVCIVRTSNPLALRTWYIRLTASALSQGAWAQGCGGGFFRLRAAKAAVVAAARGEE